MDARSSFGHRPVSNHRRNDSQRGYPVAAARPRSVGFVAAKSAFTDALGLAVLIGAGIAFVGALLVAKFMPARDPAVIGNGAQSSEQLGDDSSTSETIAEPVAAGTD